MKNIEVAFAIDDKVETVNHGVTGVISSIWINRSGIQYNLEYKDENGAIFDRYFIAKELKKTD